MSGGVVSAAAACLAADEGVTHWLHVDYGQRNGRHEAASLEALAERLSPASIVRICMPQWQASGEYPLLIGSRDLMPDALAMREGPDPAYIPGLMTSIVSAGLSLAMKLKTDRVFCGVIEDRGIGDLPTWRLYPDRSRECLAAWNWLYQIAAEGVSKSVRLEAPFIGSKQGDVMLLAHRLGVPFEHTWSCYRHGPAPCRRCYGCAARAHGFLQLGQPDPLLSPAVL